jgi:hypothetical protein
MAMHDLTIEWQQYPKKGDAMEEAQDQELAVDRAYEDGWNWALQDIASWVRTNLPNGNDRLVAYLRAKQL